MNRGPYGDVEEFLDALAAAYAATREADERRKAELRNTPQARARRSKAARTGWETRRVREQAEQAEQEYRDWRPPVPDGPWCDEMTHDAVGREIFCTRPPEHDDDCEDPSGTRWNRHE